MKNSDTQGHSEPNKKGEIPGKKHASRKRFAPRTAWHPLLLEALEECAPPDVYEIQAEVQLSREPQRADFLIIKKKKGFKQPLSQFASIFNRIDDYLLLELKGPTDPAKGKDFLSLLIHGWQYQLIAGIDQPGRLKLMVVANNITRSFRKGANAQGVVFEEEESGIWVASFGGHVLYFLETREVCKRAHEGLLYLFTGQFLKEPGKLHIETSDEVLLVQHLFQQVEQFQRSEFAMRLRGLDELAKRREEVIRSTLRHLSPEDRMRGLKPEDRVRGLKPQQVISHFTPDEILHGLSPEKRKELKKLL
jgi:hypothetical protein